MVWLSVNTGCSGVLLFLFHLCCTNFSCGAYLRPISNSVCIISLTDPLPSFLSIGMNFVDSFILFLNTPVNEKPL